MRFSTALAALALLVSATTLSPQPASAQQSAGALPAVAPQPAAATDRQDAASTRAGQSALIAENAWIRVTPGGELAAAYLTLRNVTAHDVVVTGIVSPIAGRAMIHETSQEAGQSRMRPREPMTVAAHSTVKLEPGGLHVMLHDLKQPLTIGQNVPLTVNLAGGASLQIAATVRPLSAQ